MNQSPKDVVSISKLAEGGFNRTFIVDLRDGRQVVARVPYPLTAPNYYAVASEVERLQLSDLIFRTYYVDTYLID